MNIVTANRLCELRKKNGLSQEDLANKLGVSRQAVSKWERSEASPDTDNLIELAKIYNMSLDELLNGSEAIDVITENKEADKESIETDGETVILKDDNGESIEIHSDKIVAHMEDGSTKDIDKEFIKNKLKPEHPCVPILAGVVALFITIAYILLGIILPGNRGWANYWFIFLFIPVFPSILECFFKKSLCEFNYVFLITEIYCALGMLFGLWHPLWVLFITIPVFYILADIFDKYVLKTVKDETK